MASSTTIPSARIKANRESIFIDTSKEGIIRSAPRNEMGMPSITHIASRICRNMPRTRKIRINPMKAFFKSRFSLLL
jgi:hypothetical protein